VVTVPRLRVVIPILALGLVTTSPVGAPPASAAIAPCTVSHVLRWGAHRAEVSCLEQALIDRGYTLVGPDGYLGVSTTAAVRHFQTDHGLAPDGVADSATNDALGIGAPDAGPTGDQQRGNDALQQITIGTSVQGRPIIATERGTSGGKVVLVFGVIHGNENAGRKMIELLKTQPVPPGIDLWLVDSMNPDGEALNQRQNANGVDLNRNFPRGWGPLGSPGYWQYAGPSAASEPETQAAVWLIDAVNPAITLWYHQDAHVVVPAGSDVSVYRTYAQMVGLPIDEVVGGTYTGTATQYANYKVAGGTAFVVELPGTVSGWLAMRHASAVLAVSQR
jgi:peptidoglycan hydrolase-like protein with peptidoglycan-binding domain